MNGEPQGYHEEVITKGERRDLAIRWGTLPRYVKFAAFLFLIAGATLGGYFAWEKYLSPRARDERKTEETYQSYLAWEKKREQAMREDTYGGKTPEETLNLFIAALEKGDLELASRYFVLRDDGSRDPKWLEGLEAAKTEDRISKTIVLLRSMIPYERAGLPSDNVEYVIKNEVGGVDYGVTLKFNSQANLWKIESL